MRAVGYAILAAASVFVAGMFLALAETQMVEGRAFAAAVFGLLALISALWALACLLGFWRAAGEHDRSRWDGWR